VIPHLRSTCCNCFFYPSPSHEGSSVVAWIIVPASHLNLVSSLSLTLHSSPCSLSDLPKSLIQPCRSSTLKPAGWSWPTQGQELLIVHSGPSKVPISAMPVGCHAHSENNCWINASIDKVEGVNEGRVRGQ
jgi:hypothetical protein